MPENLKACTVDAWEDVALGRTLGNSGVWLYFKSSLFQAELPPHAVPGQDVQWC